MIGPLLLAAGVLTAVPFAALTALAWFAWWPPHWLEPVLLLAFPALSIPWLAQPAPAALRRHWWGGMILLTSAWYLASPHLTPADGLSVGTMARVFAAEIELMFYGETVWSPAFRLATFATTACAAIAAVSMASWYAMAGLQWVGERGTAVAPAKPVNTLSDAAWAGRAEVIERFSTPGGIVLGELTDPRRKVRFDPAVPKRWGRQGKGPLITLDPAAGNAHSLVFSGSGSFKTAGIAIPNALTFSGSLVVVDPKGEIHAATSAVRAERGRNPWLVTEKNGLDPIRLLTAARPNDGTVFDSVADFLLPTSGDDKNDSSTFFHQKAHRLLSALLGHLYHTAAEDADYFMEANRTLAFSPDILVSVFTNAAEEHAKYPDRDFIHVVLDEIAHTEARQLSGVTATAANALSWAGHASTRGFLASDPADGEVLLERVRDDATDIYLRIPTPVLQANPGIARVLIGALVRVLRDSAIDRERRSGEYAHVVRAPETGPKIPGLRVAKRRLAPGDAGGARDDSGDSEHNEGQPRKKPMVRRLFLIDEARAMRRMDTLSAVRDEGRAYGIHLLQIFQSHQQLMECYGPHGAGAWENSVDAIVIGPVQNARQAQELSRMVGRHTVMTSSTSRQHSSQIFMPFSGTAGSSESTQLRELDLIQSSELRQLPPEAAIILAAGTAPIMASKAIWFTRADMTNMVAGARRAPEPGGRPPGKDPEPVVPDGFSNDEAVAAVSGTGEGGPPVPAKEQIATDAAAAGHGIDDGGGTEQPSSGAEGGDAERPQEAAGSVGATIHEFAFADLGRTAGQIWLELDEAERGVTVILASSDEIRAEIDDTVREGLAAEEVLTGRELGLHRLIARGMTPDRQGDLNNWAKGDAVVFRGDLPDGEARKGECFTVLGIKGEHAVLVHDDGRELEVKPGGKELRNRLDVYATAPIGIRAGDHVRWTRDDPGRGLVSGQGARVLGFGPKTVLLAAADDKEILLARDDAQLLHVEHAYSSAIHDAREIGAHQVIAVIDSGHGALLDPAAFHAEVCRDRADIVVLTDDRQLLLETLGEVREWPVGRASETGRAGANPDKVPIPPAGRGNEGDPPADDCRGTGEDSGLAEDPDPDSDENTTEVDGAGEGVVDPEAGTEPPGISGDAGAEENREEAPARVERATHRLLEVLEMAARWYRHQLREEQGAAVRAYLEGRGFDATAEGRRGFGYAPGEHGALSAALEGQGVTVDELMAAGLVGRRDEDGSTCDRFRDRLMFPIEDGEGRCMAFGGRAMNETARAKHVNSPQTLVFDEGRAVYNLGAATPKAAETGVLYVVEGFMDVASMVEVAGIENVVAPLGTAVTSEQLELMWRKADRLVVVPDGDEEGRRAAARMIDLALPLMEGKREMSFASLPEGADPDSMIQSGADMRLCMLLGEARPLVEELWRRATAGPPVSGPEPRAAVDRNLKDALARIPDPSVRDRFLDVLTALDMEMFDNNHPGGPTEDAGREAERAAGDGADAIEAVEQPPEGVEGVEGNVDVPPAGPELAGEAAGEQPGEDTEDLPAGDCPEDGDDCDAESAPDLNADENADGEVENGEEDAAPDAGQDAPSSAIAGSIQSRALYTAIVQRSQPARSHPFVDTVLNRSDVEIPPGTEARVVQPFALGKDVEHFDAWSLVFVPDDGRSPIHRIVMGTDGTIIARPGPYNAG